MLGDAGKARLARVLMVAHTLILILPFALAVWAVTLHAALDERMTVLYATFLVFVGGLAMTRYEAQLGQLFTAAPLAYSTALLWFDFMFAWWALDELFGTREFASSAGFWVIAFAPAAGLYITVRVVKSTSRWVWRG